MVNVRFGNQTIRLEPFKKWAIFIGKNNHYNVFRCVCVFLKSFCDIFGKIITTRLCLNTYKYLERFIFWHDIHYHCIIDVIDIRRLVTTVGTWWNLVILLERIYNLLFYFSKLDHTLEYLFPLTLWHWATMKRCNI